MKSTTASLAQRKADLAKIHIARQQIGKSEDEYRDLVFGMFGKRSAADLDWRGRFKLLERLKTLGFKPRPARKAKSERLANDAQSSMVRGLWIELNRLGAVRDPSEVALGAYVKRMTRVERLEWLNGRQFETVIESLKKWRDRVSDAPAG